ncbi:MAG TPA: UDP-2,3-diacylglucosamine diphosphatase [Thermoanaerobaculia bacterium]|nr:UDP-2,3-diacylglucosamine diphosphatase [Thermoanaerobaculia bacterium]
MTNSHPSPTRTVSNREIPPHQIFIIGDSHVGLSDGNEQRIVDWLGILEQHQPKALYLNGDVFHYLIAHDKFLTNSIRNFLAKLRELRSRGIPIHYVEGNRDFFLKGSFVEDAVSEIALESSFQAGPHKYLIVHGDMINDRDLPYRFWRRASKNPVSRLGLALVPRKIARNLVNNVEKRLAQSNFKHKRRLPIELMEAYGRKRNTEGFDRIVFGHFHEKTVVPSGDATVVVLPAWYESGEAMMVSPETGAYSFVSFDPSS